MESATLTPMMAQYRDLKNQHPDCVILFRLGDFYEVFFEDAPRVAQAIGIQLTRRNKAQDGQDIPMCGIPWHQLDNYLPQLIRQGFRVALCEQLEDPAEAKRRGPKSLVKRDIVRIITPGTLTEETLLPPKQASYLAAVGRVRGEIGLAWLDLSTGAFHTAAESTASLSPRLAALEPGEILIPEQLQQEPDLFEVWQAWKTRLTIRANPCFHPGNARVRLQQAFQLDTLAAFGDFTAAELAAAGALLDYVQLTQKTAGLSLRPPVRVVAGDVMQIDPATRRSLELTSTLSGQYRGSLLSVIDETVTAAGGRLLREWLANPLTDLKALETRQDAVAWLVQDGITRARWREKLRQVPDSIRALSRLLLGRGSPRDLGVIAASLAVAQSLHADMAQQQGLPPFLQSVQQGLPVALPLAATLADALEDELPALARDGGFIKAKFHPRLDELRGLARNGASHILQLEARYRQDTGIQGLKIKYNNILGYYIEVTSRFADQMRAPFVHRQTTVNGARFMTPELDELQNRLLQAESEAVRLETEIFGDLVAAVTAQGDVLRAMAEALARLDVVAGLAELAFVRRYSRPALTVGTDFAVTGARHPVVETALEQAGAPPFAANDCLLEKTSRLWLLTGPNMAGKSTFLRQNALLVILAQMGGFVPAAAARIGIVDRLFSRVGAADDLAQGRSTFMVEMVETAAILHQATDRSLVILDEIGRGTATYDGLSLAWATLEHLQAVNRCRTLFATHYHELTQLVQQLPDLASFTMAVEETGQGIVFLHQVRPGQADRSYGIFVAQLAGMPVAVLERAESLLQRFEASRGGLPAVQDLPLFTAQFVRRPVTASPVEQELGKIDPDALSPKEALETLYRLRKMAS